MNQDVPVVPRLPTKPEPTPLLLQWIRDDPYDAAETLLEIAQEKVVLERRLEQRRGCFGRLVYLFTGK